ncbi:MAG: magnesium transporter CorA family protein [Candidatus Woesearchaeota archaeon]|nr:magnesium transporter CorA family protein [Candidatus Woesearchaeota archaeon]
MNWKIITEEEDLGKIMKLPEDIILSLQDKEEMPTIEKFDGHTFIIIRIPIKKNNLEYVTIPLGIILSDGSNALICLHHKELSWANQDSILKIMLSSSKLYLSYLAEIEKTINFLEDKVYDSQKNKEIKKLLMLEKSLVFFTTALQHNQILLEELESSSFVKTAKDKAFLKKTADELRQALSMAKTYTDILTNLMDAFASMVSNNLNVAMKILTSVTILFAVPTLLASIYGMNVKLPYQGTEYGFIIVMSMSIIFSMFFLFIFWKNDMI